MNSNTLRIIIAIFFIAHGLMTMSLATVPTPQPGALRTPYLPAWWRENIDPLWPAARLGLPEGLVRAVGWVLWAVILVLFALAGAGLLGLAGLNSLWPTLALISSVLSLILLVLYWHPWLIMGIILNAAILVAIAAGWLPKLFTK